MSQVFGGAVLLPGETGNGLYASFETDADLVRLIVGDDEIGSWRREECDVSPSGNKSFHMVLGGEELTFTPSSPSAFAEAMEVPLAPAPSADTDDERPRYDYDAAIDEVIAKVKPLRNSSDEDEILSKGMLVGIIGVSTFVMAGLAAASVML